MKIVMITEFYGEGLTYQENLMAAHYLKMGHSVAVVTSTIDSVFDFVSDNYDRNKPERTYYDAGVKLIRLTYSLNLLNRIRLYRGLKEVLEAEAPDLLFVHNIVFNLLGAVRYVRARSGVRLIVDCHADYSNSAKNWLARHVLNGLLRRAMLKYAAPYVHRIFPITPACAVFMREVYHAPSDKMEILPLGADLDLSAEVRASGVRQSLREHYGIRPEEFVVITGGKLAPYKHTETLIEAFRSLKDRSAWLMVIGESSLDDAGYFEKLKNLAAGCDRVVFTGWLNARGVLEHMAMADVAAFPAAQSALWQQAIGLGMPLILGDPRARGGGIQDFTYLSKHNNVLITDETEPTSTWLARTIDELIERPERCAEMAEGARRVASEILDWDKIGSRTLA